MDLTRRLISTAFVIFLITLDVRPTHTRYHGRRLKRQHGAHMYLPESFVIPGGNETDPNEWGPWSSPSECSRSCGGGVAYQTRDCLNYSPQGAPLCQGGNRKYFSCNTQDCPDDEEDFRAQQCSKYNHIPFEGIRYNWVPYTKAPNPCELNCMPRGERFYYRHKSKVIDGTRCNDESLDVCVDGQCQPVGCDMMLGSPAREDKCRKCDGDGTNCKTMKGLIDMNDLQVGYNDVLLIPAGATNIDIQEIAPSNNYLGVRNLTSHFYLNGNWRIDFPRPMQFAGSWWHYDRRPQGFAAPDHLTSIGPTDEAIYIVLLYQDTNVGIQYEYSLPENAVKSDGPDFYAWTHSNFGPCSVSCGAGFQTRTVTCNSRTTLEQVDDSLCDVSVKPADTAQCAQEECAPRWVEGPWSKCSKPCGADGKQERTVHCERIEATGVATLVEDSVCLEKVGSQPATEQECNVGLKCPKWHIGRWLPCDKLCDQGLEKRQVVCYTDDDGKKKVVPDSECPEEKPETERECMLQPCEGVDWIVSSWSGCKACGLTQETRTAVCASKSGEIFNESFCPPEKPELVRPCKASVCEYQWFTSEWSKCSTDCGKGAQTRIVVCGQFDGDVIKPAADDSKCDAATKPEVSRECEGEKKECGGMWFAGPWGACDKPCGGGERRREVICMADGKVVSDCDPSTIEFSSEKCNTEPCTVDETLPVDSTSKPIEDDDESEDLCEDEDEDDDEELDSFTGKPAEALKLTDGIDLDEVKSTVSTLITDELMQSDATGFESISSAADTSTTLEGSGDDSSTPDLLATTLEGSGDYDTISLSTVTESIASTEFTALLGSSSDTSDASKQTTVELESSSLVGSSSSISESEGTPKETSASDVSSTESSVSDESTGSTPEVSPSGASSVDASSSESTKETSAISSISSSEGSTPQGSSLASLSSVDASPQTSTESDSSSTDISSRTTLTPGSSSQIYSSEMSSSITETTLTDNTDMTASAGSSSATESTDSSSETGSKTDMTSSAGSSSATESTDRSSATESTESSSATESTESSSATESTDSSSATESTESSSATESTDSSSATESTESSSATVSTESSSATESTDRSSATESTGSSSATESTESSSAPKSTESSGAPESTESSSVTESTEKEVMSSTDSTESTISDTSLSTESATELPTSISEDTSSDSSTMILGVSTELSTEVESTSTATSGSEQSSTTSDSSTKEESTESTLSETGSTDQSTDIESTDIPSTEGGTTETGTVSSTEAVSTEAASTYSGSTEITSAETESAEMSSTSASSDSSASADSSTDAGSTAFTTDETTTAESGVTSGDTDTSFEATSETTTMSSDSTETTYGSSLDTSQATTDSSAETDETTFDIWSTSESESSDDDLEGSTPNTLQAAITKEQTPRKCKPRTKRAPCVRSQFGCCSDNSTAAKGPFDEGCRVIKTCNDTKYKCCHDGVSPAQGENFEGCPPPPCEGSLFGCCPDGWTEAESEDFEGCPEEITTTTARVCTGSKFGCCPDGDTEASGPDGEGCDECTDGLCSTFTPETTESTAQTDETLETEFTTEETVKKSCSFSTYGCCPDAETEAQGEGFAGCPGVETDCFRTTHGCCPDNRTVATGPNNEGCARCLSEPFGCCPDGETPAHGSNQAGCCLQERFGCCPDNINAARGPNMEGCSCKYAPYGCCPDNETAAQGYYNEGCDCKDSQYGCCPDKVTPAQGGKFQGCPCHTFQFGCCPDGITIAQGLHGYGCHCSQSEFKCCPDEKTAAKGPNFEGCTCIHSKYGCCPDGNFNAEGENFEGCTNVKPDAQKACSLKKDSGPCSNYTVKYFYDVEYGACSRFWYGGCDGNENRFSSAEECKHTCEEPEGKAICSLPKVAGPCPGYYKKFYYDAARKTCGEFVYGGCLGNGNKFETFDECMSTCAAEQILPPCEQPMERGPCEGNFERWYYDNQTDICRPFSYGGCKGNKNNYPSEQSCQYHCRRPGIHKASCALPKEIGECGGVYARWHYSETEKRCMPYYYSGCGGNKNNFLSLNQCEEQCPKEVAKGICEVPADVGECQNYTVRWYYDTRELRCRQFYYGGCGGNENNFETENGCLQRCEQKPEEEPKQPESRPEPSFSSESCFLPVQGGECQEYAIRWYYNSRDGNCERFTYSGCGGNANNFGTEDECENNCFHVQHTCTLRPLFGRCHDNITRWYFDDRTRRCYEFSFSGCGGNRNNFVNESACNNFCGIDDVVETQTAGPEQFEPEYSICDEPVEAGNCQERIASWFYSNENGRCEVFFYTGCGGNGNRFESEEQCERQCGAYRGADVCREPVIEGPCNHWQTRFYYDERRGTCEPFTYGGCRGSGNRFTSLTECQSVCIVREEPIPVDNKAICALPVTTGTCFGPDSVRRWYYDDSRGTCVSFIYTGCGGNQNNFRSFESCINFCINDTAVQVDPGELRTSRPNDCSKYIEECRALHCPYGVRRSYTDDGCERCECENPCSGHECPEGTQCAVDIATLAEGSTFVPICRQINKPGECPVLNNSSSRCDRECYNDADCRGSNKCCVDGCGHVCVRPVEKQLPVTTTPRQQVIYPGDRAVALENRPPHEVDVNTPTGSYATLRCFATGNPPPTITWERGGIVIDTNQGRYIITSTGDLQIIQVVQSDSGSYVCIADNGIGTPVRREIQLQVTEPKNIDAYILSPRNATKIVTLTQPARLRCPAGGNPKPIISWWKGKNYRLPLLSEKYEIQRDYSLVINKVGLSDLGTYTCEAYSGHGRPTSIQITLKATGPVHVSNKNDEEYLKYIIEPPRAAPTERPSPQYPYRPTRPPVRIIPKPEIPSVQATPRVPVSANLRLEDGRHNYPLGADIVIHCDVAGSPAPNVTWFKNDVLLEASNRIQITEDPHRLVLFGVSIDDSGDYRCKAENEFSSNYHQERIIVEGVYVPPDCKDNAFFANCKLIVKGAYCSNPYYAKFCCRSCTLAGQLQGFHPNSV